jgi:UDP-N-acetylglucosamine--N-acetylmuramyl-(pentapeptide) pyrophosphoryl-undecaprenol N-acetylglucosamine transferase
MKIIVTGGGTGGHIFPALEIAKEIKHQQPTANVIFVGNTNSLEETMAKGVGLPFYGIAAKKIVGQSVAKKLLALVYLKIAIVKALWFLIRNRPKAVIGVGGYVSAPMLIASFFLGIKRYICEQNVVPGLANRWLARVARSVFISFEASRPYFPEGVTLLTGNPVRHEFFTLPEKTAHDAVRILVTGGSLGARFLNQHIPQALASIKAACPHLSITHQTGKHDVDTVKGIYQRLNLNADVISFISDMPNAFRTHDLLVSRAGATVCAEIMASGMPSILVPYPHANAHQRYNAEALSEAGGAIMLNEDQNFADHLARSVKELYSEPKRRTYLGVQAKSMGAKEAAFAIVQHVMNDLQ